MDLDVNGMRAFYPVMLELSGKCCLAVGGGQVAERKIAGLLEAGARVVVVSPAVTERIAEWEASGKLTLFRRTYESGDGTDAALVFACTDKRDVNERVYRDATARGQPVNVADRPELCTFVVPAVWRRGPLLVAVSTSGTSPMASSRIRDRIEAAIGDDIEPFLEYAAEFRQRLLGRVSDAAERKRLLAELFGDEALDRVRAGDWDGLRVRMERLLDGMPP